MIMFRKSSCLCFLFLLLCWCFRYHQRDNHSWTWIHTCMHEDTHISCFPWYDHPGWRGIKKTTTTKQKNQLSFCYPFNIIVCIFFLFFFLCQVVLVFCTVNVSCHFHIHWHYVFFKCGMYIKLRSVSCFSSCGYCAVNICISFPVKMVCYNFSCHFFSSVIQLFFFFLSCVIFCCHIR